KEIINETGADKVYWNRCYEPTAIARDKHIKQSLSEQAITVSSFNSHLLHEPHTIKNKQRKPFKVFTPFWKHYQTLEVHEPLKITKTKLTVPAKWPVSEKITGFGLVPRIKWYTTISDTWEINSTVALKRVRTFIRD